MRRYQQSIVRGLVYGAAAGLLASFAMNKFQEAAASQSSDGAKGSDDPATVKAAQMAVGHDLPKDEKPAAGNAVHYAFGAILGVIYGVAAEFSSTVTAGFGVPYGFVVALLADEAAVPALGLSGPPWESPGSTHAYSLASHAVFGAVLEITRRTLLALL